MDVWVRTKAESKVCICWSSDQQSSSSSSSSSSSDGLLRQIKEQIAALVSESEKIGSPILLASSSSQHPPIVIHGNKEDSFNKKLTELEEIQPSSSKRVKEEETIPSPLYLCFLSPLSSDYSPDSGRVSLQKKPPKDHAPIATIEKGNEMSEILLHLDVISRYDAETTLKEVLSSQRKSLFDQLNQVPDVIAKCLEAGEGNQLPKFLEAFHFELNKKGEGQCGVTHNTVLFPFGVLSAPGATLPNKSGWVKIRKEIRKALHEQFSIPSSNPTFVPTLALSFPVPSVLSSFPSLEVGSFELEVDRLLNPHKEITRPSGVKGGVQYLVQGSYMYYHYNQDRFSDNGWGCAYRSLQTLASWIMLQNLDVNHQHQRELALDFPGQVEVPGRQPPSHLKIQQTLVNLGDKKSSFVKSSQWIGAMEVTLVLDKLYGISCRVIHVNSGREVPSRAREFAMHFETVGSPIMIGGGVLAYTLLGIDWNQSTGSVKFLILDPHYVGTNESAKAVIDKGWCAWKDESVFLPDCFYNFCLPLKPDDCY